MWRYSSALAGLWIGYGIIALECPLLAADPAPPVPRHAGLSDLGRPVTTDSAEAQTYFNQGLCFLFAFNHDEAIRSFAEAARHDPRAQWPGGESRWPTARISISRSFRPSGPKRRGQASTKARERGEGQRHRARTDRTRWPPAMPTLSRKIASRWMKLMPPRCARSGERTRPMPTSALCSPNR